jgi:VCBS repeat-containing protein
MTTNHNPVFTSSSATGSFTELTNTTDSTTLHTLSGTMNFTDSDHTDTHTTTAFLASAVLSSGSVIPASSLTHFQSAMTSSLTSDHNGSGSVKWSFSDADDDFDFLSKNQTLTLTYDVKISDNHGGSAIQTVKVTVTGTDDKPVINMTTLATVTEQTDKILSLSPDTVHVAMNFTDDDLTNTNFTATVTGVTASGNTSGLLPDGLGNAELLAFYHVDNVVKNSGSSAGIINTTFSAPDLAFDYLAAGEHLNLTYTVKLDDNAGGISTQTVMVTVVGTNDKPFYLSGPEYAHLEEDHHVSPAGNLTAQGDLAYTDIDLSDTHTVSTTVSASLSGGGSIPLTNAQLLALFSTTNHDSTGHVLGDVSWNFSVPNSTTNFIQGGQTLTLDYKVTIHDPSGATDTQDVIITILGDNHPVVITSGPESSTVAEQDNTTGSAAPDTTPTTPAGTLNFTDADTGDTHTVAVTLASTSSTVPAATQADLANAVTTVLHDSTGTGSGSVDWNFAIADKDLDYLSAGQTLTVDWNVKVSDASTSATQTVEVVITGSNDPVTITSGPESASVAEQPNTVGSDTPDTTPVQTLAFTDVDLADTHSVSVALDSAVWSANPDFIPGQTFNDLQNAIITTLHDSTGNGAGTIDWNFSIADKDLDFLAPGDTLTATYDITVSDGITTSTQQVTVTATGAADPSLVLPASTDAFDTVSTDAGSLVAVGNAIADPGDQPGDASTTLSITAVNGSSANVDTFIAGTYGQLFVDSSGFYEYIANTALDQLLPGQDPTEQFNITVTNSLGQNYDTTLTFNFHGADDQPIVTSADVVGSVTEDAGPTLLTNGDFEAGLAGWTTTGSDIHAEFLGIGGEFGNTSVVLAPPGGIATQTLSQSVATTAGTHYLVSFTVFGDPESGHNEFIASWNGTNLLDLVNNTQGGTTTYTFDVVGDGGSDALAFTYNDDGNGIILDNASVNSETPPATQSAGGHIAFTDVETGDTHTVSATPDSADYVGTFTLDSVTESGGSGSTNWHFTVDNADLQFLAQNQVLTQTYHVTIADENGATTIQDIAVALHGQNDAPTAVGETVVTDAGASGTVDVPTWALAANDTDPDTTDQLSFSHVVSASGGATSNNSSDVFFFDDATNGGSFDYQTTDGIATSNTATATIVNNAASASTLTAAGSGDSILIATNGTEALQGGSGNDVLIGNSGSHTMSGGGGNDTFAFLHTTDGPGIITDFNNSTQHDHIAISSSGYGGGLTAGMDVSSTFETSGDNQFSGSGAEFHFDTANQTLYFSSDGSQASAIAVTSVQNGVVLTPHDLLIV